VILIARRQPTDEIRREIDQFNGRVQVMLADVSNKHQVLTVFNQIAQQQKSISIIHSAGIADDVLIQAQNTQRFSRVFDAKCKGLLNLKRAVEQYKIRVENWILNSSVSSVLGNVGQSNYAAANAFLDTFAQLHSNVCSVNWANWLEVIFKS
jgi:NADP-dependent 3-hydroxy acid dehydrogenase YdfG